MVPVAAQSWMVRAMPADLEGGLALFVSALQGSLATGSAVGGVIYDAKGPGGVLVLAAVAAAAGSLSLLGRAGAAISSPPPGPAGLAREPAEVTHSRPYRGRYQEGRKCHAERDCDDRIRTA
jgi:hypothetical protein